MQKMDSSVEKYGGTGSGLLVVWEAELENIRRKAKFNPEEGEDEQRLRALKQRISNEMDNALSKLSISRFVFAISVVVAVIGFILMGLLDKQEIPFVVLLAGVLAAVFVKRVWEKDIYQLFDAIVDFDNHYFDGEIIFKRKNRIPL